MQFSTDVLKLILAIVLSSPSPHFRELLGRNVLPVHHLKKIHGITPLKHLPVYEYAEYLLTEISKHEDDTNLDFLDDLLPWSPNLPERCRKSNKYEVKQRLEQICYHHTGLLQFCIGTRVLPFTLKHSYLRISFL